MAKNYSKQEINGYNNYVKRYAKAEAQVQSKGGEMYRPQYNFREYVRKRRMIKDSGVKQNINQTMVAEQKFQYSDRWAKTYKKVTGDKSVTYTQLRQGAIDVSAYNEFLIDNKSYVEARIKELSANDSKYANYLTKSEGSQRSLLIGYDMYNSEV